MHRHQRDGAEEKSVCHISDEQRNQLPIFFSKIQLIDSSENFDLTDADWAHSHPSSLEV